MKQGFRTLFVLLLVACTGCTEDHASRDAIPIGLLLSFTGPFAANSINSERAVTLAVEAANAAGGIGGRPITVLPRDTRSDIAKVAAQAEALLAAKPAVIIGPDTVALANQLRAVLPNQTLIMPSFATSDAGNYKPRSWFVMGPSPSRMACELAAQLAADGRKRPLVVETPEGYNVLLGLSLAIEHGYPIYFLPTEDSASRRVVDELSAAAADAFVLATQPPAASSMLFALAAVGALADPSRWYLSPTLHTPALLETVPKGLLGGARGVAAGTGSGAAEFRRRFAARWRDQPLDDAYAFFDATTIVALALERAVTRTGVAPTGAALGEHIVAVTRSGNPPVRWNELALGLDLLRAGSEVGYVGLAGPIEFDSEGNTRTASANWWSISDRGFEDIPRGGDCR